MTTVSEALAAATSTLQGSDSAQLDAQLLLGCLLRKPRSWLYTWPEAQLTAVQALEFAALCARRAAGEPVAYLTGRKAFWTFELEVGPGVLIPRPETEVLVEQALEYGKELRGKVADLGTGSGAVALALAGERADWQLYATERSAEAQIVAAANFRASGLRNLRLLAGHWCVPLPGRDFVMIVSNPPYIDAADPHLEQGDVRFEPPAALIAAEEGLAELRHIAGQAREYLVEGGWLLLEHGWQQGGEVRRLLAGLGYADVRTHRDQGDRERVTVGRRSGADT
jgi:release factor glutamine methyltransferase